MTMTLRHKILALAVVPLLVAIIAIAGLLSWQSTSLAGSSIDAFERNMLKAKEAELLNLTNLAISAIDTVYRSASANDVQAKVQVRDILHSLDYGQDGYFFVYDYAGNNVVHPRQTYRPGQNWFSLVDPDGNHVIENLIQKAKQGGGLYQYKWERPSTGETVDKLSFAVGLDKWGWMLGTGVYLDEVYAQTASAKAELSGRIGQTFMTIALIAVPAVLIVFLSCTLLNLHEQRMADGKLKQLTQRIVDTQEEERSRLARELHDGISQNLVGVRYAIDLARRKVVSHAKDAVGAIDRSAQELNRAIQEVRQLSHDLRPRLLDDLGLSPAIEALCNHFSERTGIAMELDFGEFKSRLKPEPATALYRVMQEALTNIERHAGASVVSVSLSSYKGRVNMVITDNGRGMDIGERPSGLGLRNMQERMAHFGGVLLIQSGTVGTTLRALLPLSASLGARDKTAEAA
jgi:two-component system NarL family sensor kinase